MARRAAALFILLGALGQLGAAQAAPSSGGERFSLNGSVVNSVTGAPVGHALVRANSFPPRFVFSDGEGNFLIDGLSAGRVNVTAQKPGFVGEQDAPIHTVTWVDVGSGSGSLVLKLIPQSAIFGRVVDAAGQPIERVPLRLTNLNLRDGHKRWEGRGMTETDDDGGFRFPNLMPGIYYLSAGPSNVESHILTANEKPKAGYPLVYYPGVSDLTAAAPLQVTAGQQIEADISMGAVPVYQLSGTVTGYLPEQGVGIQIFNQSGDELSMSTSFSMENGFIHVDSIPAGTYIVRAFAQSGSATLRAEARVNVSSNVENLRLALQPALSIPIVVRAESRSGSGQSSTPVNLERPPVSVRLMPSQPMAQEVDATFVERSRGHTLVLQNVDPGTYAAELMPQPPWYIQSATYGQTNLLYDDLYVGSGGQGYPLDIVLRDDGASIAGTVKTPDNADVQATIVALPQPASKIPPKTAQYFSGGFNISGLAPGDYLVFAFDRTESLEFANPEALQAYASQAAHITLTPGQKAQIVLDLISTGKGE
ncbi:MAG: carboxypeptidase regulatory-like domain-containing protein [Candidatus Korobacteraceae bacterium]